MAREPAFVISANSSDAEAPPVITSDTSTVDVGHATAAASRSANAGAAAGPEPAGAADRAMTRNRTT
jgi:hypothetical protein